MMMVSGLALRLATISTAGCLMTGLVASDASAVTGYHTSASSVRVRAGASTQTAQINQISAAGTTIDIGCQAVGETITASGFGTSAVWDYLNGYGGYISDLFVQETPYAVFDPRIPRCGVVTPPPPPPPPPAPAPKGGCVNGVHVFGAQGTDDPQSTTIAAAVGSLRRTLSGGTMVVNDPLDYGAASLSPWYTYDIRYNTAVTLGVQSLVQILQDHLSRCPATEHLVVMGYSQGADVAARAWDIVASNGGMDRYRGRLDALILFGHPQFNPAQRDPIPAYSLDTGSFSTAGHGGLGSLGVQTWTRSQEAYHLMRSYCKGGDLVCNTTATSTLLSNWVGVHTSYQNSYAISAGQKLGAWLNGHYGLR
jgi:hypothetical protein